MKLFQLNKKMVGKYIIFNNQKRNKAKNKFKKDLFELLSNGSFGNLF